MANLVLNIRKNKGNAGGVGAHIDRKEGMEHMFTNANPELRHLNKHFVITKYCDMPLPKAIDERIKDGYTSQRAIRKDAVRSIGLVLTGSHEQMKKIVSNPKAYKYWLANSLKFVKDEFGKENIVRYELHMDERTPHLHVVVVPLTKDGRLSAREVMGNKARLKALRKKYAEHVKALGLQYGNENKGKKSNLSTKISDFYKLVENFDAEYQNRIKTLKTANFEKLSPRQKTEFLNELQKAVKVKDLKQDIFDKFLVKFSRKKGL